MLGLVFSACASGPSEREGSTRASPTEPSVCSVTVPPASPFVPPDPYPQEASAGGVWYGTAELWTVLEPDGAVWSHLPVAQDGSLGDKTLWWSRDYSSTLHEDFDGDADITVRAVRLDGPAPSVVEGPGVPSHHAADGNFLLVGLEVPRPGCWEVTARYRGAELTYTMSVGP